MKKMQQQYMDIEQEVAALWPASFSRMCADCTDICCRPHMADEVLESDWLSDISQQAHGKWWNKSSNPKCRALNDQGCVLRHGKPPFCTSFHCDKLLVHHNPYELVANLFLANILTALCKLDKNLDLLELTADEWAIHQLEISARLSHAESLIRLVKQFRAASREEQAPIAFRMLVEMPSLLTISVQRALLETGASHSRNYKKSTIGR